MAGWLFFLIMFLVIIMESMKTIKLLRSLYFKGLYCLFSWLVQDLNLFLKLLDCLGDLGSVQWWKNFKLVESVQRIDAMVDRVTFLFGFNLFGLLGLLWSLFISFALLALNDLTTTFGFSFPSLFLSKVKVFKISLSLFFSFFLISRIWLDIFTVPDHKLTKFNGLPVRISIEEGISCSLKFKLFLFIALLSFFVLFLPFLSLFLSVFELLLLLGLSFLLFLFSFFVFLLAFSLEVNFL